MERKIKQAIFDDIMSYIAGSISSAKYVSDDGEHIAEIRSVTLTGERTVAVDIIIEKSNIRIKEIQLYGKNGHLWACVNVNITLDKSVAGVLYRFELSIEEVLSNV